MKVYAPRPPSLKSNIVPGPTRVKPENANHGCRTSSAASRATFASRGERRVPARLRRAGSAADLQNHRALRSERRCPRPDRRRSPPRWPAFRPPRMPLAPIATTSARACGTPWRCGRWDAEHVHFALSALRLSGKWCDKIEVTAAGDLAVAVAATATGELEGDAALSGDEFVYETRAFGGEGSEPCVISLRFAEDVLTVKQDGTSAACGFVRRRRGRRLRKDRPLTRRLSSTATAACRKAGSGSAAAPAARAWARARRGIRP